MSIDRLRFGSNIRRLRRAAGLTQQELADKVGCTNVAISAFERGSSMPSVTSVADIAAGLGVGYGVLFDEPLAVAEHAVSEVRAKVRRLGYDVALIPMATAPYPGGES